MRLGTLAKNAAAVLVTGAVGGLASRPAQSSWYAKLRKPSFQPPRQVFPIVWPLLYADIAAVSATTVDQLEAQRRPDKARAYRIALAVNLVLNASWSWLFFNRRMLGTSAVAAAALTASSADLSRRAIDARTPSGAPLVPYPVWCAFATVLSTRIWMLNR
ncbi:TspO protein [Mycobacteriaceae bacterium 1482268.1]|nr:TspO protein [Mycobacteriaceae bacterium 1482268.1]